MYGLAVKTWDAGSTRLGQFEIPVSFIAGFWLLLWSFLIAVGTLQTRLVLGWFRPRAYHHKKKMVTVCYLSFLGVSKCSDSSSEVLCKT